jgi:hypothetical protein
MFHTYVASVFIWMLHMFAIVFLSVFAYVSAACSKYFSCFVYMLLVVFYLNVSKVDCDVCMLQCEPLDAAACSCWGAVHGGVRRNKRGGHGKERSVGE